MKIYDISQEVFNSQVYPGDPIPEKKQLQSMENGDLYNLTAFSMCAHNGTHVDAPRHFIKDGKAVNEMPVESVVGMAYVTVHNGALGAEDADRIVKAARENDPEAAKRILIKGDAVVSTEAAEVFAASGILLLGNESQSVGPEEAPMATHLALLSHEIVLLEGVRLSEVPEGVYLLSAAPLNLSGRDGAPCRAILIGK